MANQSPGKVFEHQFKASCEKQGIWIYRLPDSYWTAKKTDQNAIVAQNPSDFIAHYNGELYFIECKTTNKNYITIGHDGKSGQIAEHQYMDLQRVIGDHEHSLFILQFNRGSDEQKTYGMKIEDFVKFLNNTGRASITPLLIVQNGGFIIDQEKLRVHYTYDIKKALDKERSDT